jgi:dipeptidyl aminopeptidase/acylaminoacyl peptidase
MNLWARRVGDFRTDEGRMLLAQRSPLTHVEQITRPLLIGQGAADRHVKQSESARIVETLERNGVPVTYVVYPDEGHGFAHRPNRLAFYAVAEAFLGKYLGGRVEPVGSDFDDSSITIPTGRQHIAVAMP